jgi:hypothetical protein
MGAAWNCPTCIGSTIVTQDHSKAQRDCRNVHSHYPRSFPNRYYRMSGTQNKDTHFIIHQPVYLIGTCKLMKDLSFTWIALRIALPCMTHVLGVFLCDNLILIILRIICHMR